MRQDNQVAESKPLGILSMALLALAVGIIAGVGAVVFRKLIGVVHNLLFLRELSFEYNANLHTAASPWEAWVVLVPVVGAVGVAFLVKTLAPEAKGAGVPEVMDAIYYKEGCIRPVVAVVKPIASALSIGSGGSVGREGPIAQIGAAIGSILGQVIPMPVKQRVTLIAAGVGGGIGATFNAPIGGLAFAAELVMPAITAVTVLPVALATATATYVGRYFLGLQPAFNIPELTIPAPHLGNPVVFLLFAGFGLLLGLVAALFVRAIYWFEDRFDSLPGNYYTRHMLGMLVVGVMIYVLMTQYGHYYVHGVGYATIEDILRGTLSSPAFLLLLVGAKLLATGLTLGSGASGGIFSPSLFLGAALGGFFGTVAQQIFPDLAVDATVFAVAGMAGMVGGTTGAVVTAITMLFEMTRNYNAILPVILTVAITYTVRNKIVHASIYTLKLLRRGHPVPVGLQAIFTTARRATDVMTSDFVVLHAKDGLDWWPERKTASKSDPVVVVQSEGEVVGVLCSRPVASGSDSSAATLGDLAERDCVFVAVTDVLIDVLAAMRSHHANVALVTRDRTSPHPADIVGVITDRQIASEARRITELLG